MSYIGQTLPADSFQGFTTDSFTGDGSATTFTLSKEPFSEDTLIVVINNVIQKPTTNFSVSGTTLTIVGTAVASGDVIYAIHMGGVLPIGSASALDATTACTITTDDNTDTLSLISTDADATNGPNLRMYRNSASPADNDELGILRFDGRNDNSEDITFAQIKATVADASDGTEDAVLNIQKMVAGSLKNVLKISETEAVFNEGSVDLDFRVESNDGTHALFVDAGNNVVGIGTSEPNSYNNYANNLVVLENGHAGITIVAGTSNNSSLYFADGTSGNAQYRGWVDYLHASDSLRLATGGDARMIINSNGRVGIGTTNEDHVFQARGAASAGTDGFLFSNTLSSGTMRGLQLNYSAQAPDDTNYAFAFEDSSAVRLVINNQGDVYNHDNVYQQLSDERIKQNITDANSQWDDFKAIKFKNFERKDDVRAYGEGKKIQLGVVAQEIETVSPNLISHKDPDKSDIISDSAFGTLYEDGDNIPENKQIGDIKEIKEQVKGVKYSVLYLKGMKALQEAMAKIETLETKVKALEDA